MNLEDFLTALHGMKKIRVTFRAVGDGEVKVRTCAPMDYGPSKKAKDGNDKFHMWDYDSSEGAHTLSINPEQVISIEILEEEFDPEEFVTWSPSWIVERDWGDFS